MKIDTLLNFILFVIFSNLGASALVAAIFFNAWWHFFTSVACLGLSYVLWNDSSYGCESIKEYFHRKIEKK